MSLWLLGCGSKPLPQQPEPPFPNVKLNVLCRDATLAAELTHRAKAWTARSGASINFISAPPKESTPLDGAILLAPEFSDFAAAGQLYSVPLAYRSTEHPAGLDGLLDAYKYKICTWGTTSYAVPIVGEGYVLVYRADLFADAKHQQAYKEKHKEVLDAPRTWEGVTRIASYFTETLKKPALPPLPADEASLLFLFQQMAACYDRKPVQLSDLGGKNPENISETSLRFHLDPYTLPPRSRITAPAFRKAMDWFAATRDLRPNTPGDSLSAITEGSAVIAVVTLAELARLPRGADGVVLPRFGVASLPGTAVWYNDQESEKKSEGGRNFIPFIGSGLRVGVVFQGCNQPEAMWDFYAELGSSLGQTSLLAQAKLGGGAVRSEHTNEGQDRHLENYGFEEERTKKLNAAIREGLPNSCVNPVVALRTPDQAERMSELAKAVRLVSEGKATPIAALESVEASWQKLTEKAGERWPIWCRKSQGQD